MRGAGPGAGGTDGSIQTVTTLTRPTSLTASVPEAARAEGALAEAYAHCREVTRARARNFYYGLRLTPEPRRSAIYAIYAWMRAADDAADEAGTLAERRERLQAFAEWTRGVMAGEVDSGTREQGLLAAALRATVRAYPVDREIFDDMLLGLRLDLDRGQIADEEQLAHYCYCVAGTAGLACVRIWGLREGADADRARDLTLRRGQAFQRTNILRDFAEDFDGSPRRVYLPASAFRAHGLTPRELRAWSDPARCEALVREQAGLAREHYRASAELETMVDAACAPTLWAMTRIYSGLLTQIEAEPRRVVGDAVSGGRARLAPATKATIAIRAAIGARMHRW